MRILQFSFSLLMIFSCTQNNLKEKAYPRVYLPKKEYKVFNSNCGYSFEIPIYSQIEKKDLFRNEKLNDESCWTNIVFPDFNGKLHISYKYYDNIDTLHKLMEDSYKLTSKHNIKASYIKDSIFENNNCKGMIYLVGGNAASDIQFVLTDFKNKFIRGAMYFNNTPNIDSMRPIIEFVHKDLTHLMSTTRFK